VAKLENINLSKHPVKMIYISLCKEYFVRANLSNYCISTRSRYLILIDDVWSIAAWDAIRSKLPGSNCGSRIIVTTRMDNVAKACSDANDGYIHRMKKLDEKDSEQLFVSKAFGSGNSCPQDLEAAMRSILKKCGGLPLAIVSIASLLATYKPPEGKDMWEKSSEINWLTDGDQPYPRGDERHTHTELQQPTSSPQGLCDVS